MLRVRQYGMLKVRLCGSGCGFRVRRVWCFFTCTRSIQFCILPSETQQNKPTMIDQSIAEPVAAAFLHDLEEPIWIMA